MINYAIRYVKRFAVLVPGIVIAYLAAHTVYPIFDRRVAQALAIFFTYVVTAYVLIPLAIRVLRFLVPARHLPLYCVTPDGFASDPINVGVIGSKHELVQAMRDAGWSVADAHSLPNIAREIFSILLSRSYSTAPMSSLFLFGRKQDIGFELVREGRGQRHHVRFWATTYEPDKTLSVRSIHWAPRKKLHGNSTTVLWLGAASRDTGITFVRHTAQLTHMIHPNTDKERDLIAGQLSKLSGHQPQTIRLEEPYRLINRAWRGYLQTDGKLKVVKL